MCARRSGKATLIRNPRLALALVTGLFLLSPPAGAVLVSMDGDEAIDGIEFDDRDIIQLDSNPGSAELWLDWDEAFLYEDVDALTFLPNGNLLLSVSGATVIGGLSVEDGDLLEIDLDAGTARFFLRESALGSLDVDAVHLLSNGHLLLSFHRDEEIHGLPVRDGDVIEYDMEDHSFSIFLSEDVFDVDADVNGVALLPNGNLAITTDENVVIAGLPVEDSEIAEYDLETGAVRIFLSFEARVGQADVDAIALPGAECEDGLDNDGDGWIDHSPESGMGDPGCVVPEAASESPECQDGLDNQGDGTIDYDGGVSALGEGSPGLRDPDPSCTLPWREREGSDLCGLGFELTFLLVPLLGLRRTRPHSGGVGRIRGSRPS
jgi:hypothetical protein